MPIAQPVAMSAERQREILQQRAERVQQQAERIAELKDLRMRQNRQIMEMRAETLQQQAQRIALLEEQRVRQKEEILALTHPNNQVDPPQQETFGQSEEIIPATVRLDDEEVLASKPVQADVLLVEPKEIPVGPEEETDLPLQNSSSKPNIELAADHNEEGTLQQQIQQIAQLEEERIRKKEEILSLTDQHSIISEDIPAGMYGEVLSPEPIHATVLLVQPKSGGAADEENVLQQQRPAVEHDGIPNNTPCSCCTRRQCMLVAGAVCLVVVTVAVLLGTTLSSKDDSNGTRPSITTATPGPTLAPEPSSSPSPAPRPHWNQLGDDLMKQQDKFFGSALALSATGTVLAAASMRNETGVVQVYGWNNGTWSLIGDVLQGDASSNDQFGAAVALSANGTVLAVGAPLATSAGSVRVYRYGDGEWRLVQTLVGEASGDAFGTAVALSADGSILAAGAPENDGNARIAGSVRVFQYNAITRQFAKMYVWLGGDLDGETSRDRFGSSVALSDDGLVLAAGAQRHGDDAGHVRIFAYDYRMSQYKMRGQAIMGEVVGDWFGKAVAMSANGTIVAATSRRNGVNGKNAGEARVLRYNNETNKWIKMGQSVRGGSANDHFGTSVSLSADGLVLACGATHHNGPAGNNAGNVRIFSYDRVASEWKQVGQSLDGDAAGDFFGSTVALSDDGTTVAAGSPSHNVNNVLIDTGKVRVYGSLPQDE